MKPGLSRILVRGGALALAALALVALVVPLAKTPDDRSVPSSVFTDYFAARGQSYCWGDCPASAPRTCISGDCPCFDEPYRTQCFAERKSSFASQNPPRGEITGVCWAALGKWERDPQSGQQAFRTRSPIYSRVRFNETQTLSKWARDDRDAGFEVEVGPAWSEFVQQNYAAENPATDGWSWSTSCVSLSSPRNTEDQNWTKAQEQASYQRVFMPTYGVADTPEERAAEAKAKAEREARAAEQKRIAADRNIADHDLARLPAMNRAPGANFVHLSGPPADEGDTHGPGVTRSRNIKRRPANGTFVTERRGIGMVVASWIIARASSSFARCRKTPVYAG